MLNIFLILYGTLGCASSENDFYPVQPDAPDEEESSAYYLGVDLQDGFQADTVEIRLNGELVREIENVTTSLLIGMATSVETQINAGKIVLSVNVLTRDVTSSLELDLLADTFVGVSLTADGIDFIVSDSPFGYG